MIPICLITGFLGSGKTTLLRAIHQRHADRRLIYLVNEFSTADVDGDLVSGFGANVVSVAGGSIFCKCKVTEFITQLKTISEQRADQPFEGVVIEASGIANPKVIHQMLAEAQLDDRFAIARVVALVDPGSFAKLLATLPNITAQVESADLAIINKCDLHEEDALATTEQSLREINPDLQAVRTTHGQVEFELFSHTARQDITGQLAGCVDPNFAKFAFMPNADLDLELVRTSLAALADDLYRAKGFLRVDEKWIYVDHAAGQFQSRPAPEYDGPAELAVIVRGDAASQAWEHLSIFQGSDA